MDIFLVRHGEVDSHYRDRFYGGLEVELSPNGRLQADAAGRMLAEVPLHAVYSSPLGRAGFGAERVIHWQKQVSGQKAPLNYLEELREIDRGRWSGLLKSEVLGRWPNDLKAHWQDLETWREHGGESLGDLRNRVWRGFEQIVQQHRAGDQIAVVAHLFPISAVLARAEERPLQAWMDWAIPTGSVSKIRQVDGFWETQFVGEVPA